MAYGQLQVKKKFVKDDAVDGAKIRLLNDQPLRAENADGAVLELLKVSSANELELLQLPKAPSAPTKAEHVTRKDYVDLKVSDEKSRAEAAEAQLSADLAAEVAARTAAVSSEASARSAADSALQTALATETSNRQLAVSAEASARSAADAELTAEIEAEIVNRQAAVSSEAATRSTEDSRILSESKTYTDQKITALVGGSPEVLDTLRELAQAIGDDSNFVATVTSNIASAKSEANAYTVSSLNALGERFVSEHFIANSEIVENGYINLANKAFVQSMVVTVDRLCLFEGLDYWVSEMSGVTRITLRSELQTSEEAVTVGDRISIRYLKDIR